MCVCLCVCLCVCELLRMCINVYNANFNEPTKSPNNLDDIPYTKIFSISILTI